MITSIAELKPFGALPLLFLYQLAMLVKTRMSISALRIIEATFLVIEKSYTLRASSTGTICSAIAIFDVRRMAERSRGITIRFTAGPRHEHSGPMCPISIPRSGITR